MMGPPEFAENPVPTWDEFCTDYQDFFFDESLPEVGRSFVIEHNGEAIGHTNYQIDAQRSFAELDIWMRDSSCTDHGWGSEALRLLCDHLHATLGIREMILRPSARNMRAIRSYEKAGFARASMSDEETSKRYGPGEYRDTVVMRRVIGPTLAPTAGEPAR